MMTHDELVERMRAWSYHRQLLGKRSVSALHALEHVVSVYSSHPSAPLSLLARTDGMDGDAFRQLEVQRLAVRLPAMRASVFQMPVELAPKLLAATGVPLEKLERRLQYGGFDWNDYAELKTRILDAAREPVSAAELQDAVPTDGKLMVVVRLMAYEGLMLRIGTGLRSDNFHYVAAESWLGAPLDKADPDESLHWLASAYLNAFGPARIADFAWWSGVTKRRATAAIQALPIVEIGDGLLLLELDLEAFEQQDPIDPDAVAVIPKWDAYTMGYAADGRARFIAEKHVPVAYGKSSGTTGDGLPLVLRGGLAVGLWAHRFQGDRLTVSVTPFKPDVSMDWLDPEVFRPVADLLEAIDLQVNVRDRQ